MNILIDSMFLFIYLFALFYSNIPNVSNEDYLIHKIYIFVSTLAYFYIILSIKNLQTKNKSMYEIYKESFIFALYCVIGYSIYVDLSLMESTKYIFDVSQETSPLKKYLQIITIIVLFVIIMQLLQSMFQIND